MKITPLRIAAFVVLVVAFFGYFRNDIPERNANLRGIGEAWYYCAILFFTGAGCATFGDQEIEMFPPTSLRWLYVLVGGIIKIVSTAWMTSIDNVAPPKQSAGSVRAHIFAQC